MVGVASPAPDLCGPPTGIPALTSRAMREADIAQVGEFIHQSIQLALQAKADHEAAVKAGGSAAKPTIKVTATL